MPLSATSMMSDVCSAYGSHRDARRRRRALLRGQFVDRFDRVLDEVDQHLMKLALTDVDLLRRPLAVDAGPDATLGQRIAQHPERARQRLVQVYLLAFHAGRPGHLLRAHDVGDVVGPVVHALDRPGQLLILPGAGRRQRHDGRHHLPAARGVSQVVDQVVPVPVECVRERAQPASELVVRQASPDGLDADGDAGDRVAHVVQDRVDNLQSALRECLRQGLLGMYALGHVAEGGHAASDASRVVEQRARAHPDVQALRPVRVADEQDPPRRPTRRA